MRSISVVDFFSYEFVNGVYLCTILQCVPPKNAEDGLGSSSPDSCLEEDMVQLNLLSEDESDH